MIDLPRTTLPLAAGPSGQAPGGQLRAGLPVPAVMPVPPAPAQDDRDETSLRDWRRAPKAEIEPWDSAQSRTGSGPASGRQARIVYAGGGLAGSQDTPRAWMTGGIAFLTQQIFQEAMQTGLYLEPWTQGIGAYRRAGAEPPLQSADPAVLSLMI